jgi:molecular chaperone GrpE
MSDSDNRNDTDEAPEQLDGGEAPAMPPATAEEVQELKDRLLRTLAEMENLRARTQREVEEARKFAVTGFARDLLEVGDNLGRALASVPAEARAQSEFMTNPVQGVEMTERSLRSALERHQVRRVSPQKGERFDHKLHQAMFEVPSAELAPGSVAEVIQDGYVLADRLLRPALVGVAKAPPDAPSEQSGSRIDRSA